MSLVVGLFSFVAESPTLRITGIVGGAPITLVSHGQELLPISKCIEKGERRREEERKKRKKRRDNRGDGTTLTSGSQLTTAGSHRSKEKRKEEGREGREEEHDGTTWTRGYLGFVSKGILGIMFKKKRGCRQQEPLLGNHLTWPIVLN